MTAIQKLYTVSCESHRHPAFLCVCALTSFSKYTNLIKTQGNLKCFPKWKHSVKEYHVFNSHDAYSHFAYCLKSTWNMRVMSEQTDVAFIVSTVIKCDYGLGKRMLAMEKKNCTIKVLISRSSGFDPQDETSVVAGTSEGTVIQFQFLSVVLGQEDKEWVRTRTFKNHTHDVRAVLEINMAIVSGGLVTLKFFLS